jgi:hypothetical protein
MVNTNQRENCWGNKVRFRKMINKKNVPNC